MAGLPKTVIERAKEISAGLEKTDLNKNMTMPETENTEKKNRNITEIMGILKDLKIETLTPLNAFEILNDLMNKAKG